MSVYPSNIPTTGDLPDAGANLSSNPHSSLHDDVRDEVIAIAGELGIEPSGTASTVRARLDQGLGLRQIVVFTANGTFTKATYPWLRAVRVRVQAGGGGGGAAAASGGATEAAAGGGGGGGGYSESFSAVGSLATSVTVTVGTGGAAGTGSGNGGNGGNSSFGSLCVANGGSGGGGSAVITSANTVLNLGGVAGVQTGAVGNIVRARGSDGHVGMAGLSGSLNYGGQGGASFLGGGGRVNSTTTGGAGADGNLYGGGGAGGHTRSSTGFAGGAGVSGIVIVELYA